MPRPYRISWLLIGLDMGCGLYDRALPIAGRPYDASHGLRTPP